MYDLRLQGWKEFRKLVLGREEAGIKPLWHVRDQTPGFGGWHGILEIIQSTKGIVLFGFPSMWFALTGKIGWREDQRPAIV
ncbi:MAG: hypothetical protein JWR15_3952 [Prosthecobacter sp.]|nr:hypothetical protein [Prosthecobacter sp.]